jgi:hypothetical protein
LIVLCLLSPDHSTDGNWTDAYMKLTGPSVTWTVKGNHTRWNNVFVDVTNAALKFADNARIHIGGQCSVAVGAQGVFDIGKSNIVSLFFNSLFCMLWSVISNF